MIRDLAPADLDDLVPLFGAYLDFYQVPRDPAAERRFLSERLAAPDSKSFGAFDPDGVLQGFALCHLTHNSLRLAPAWILHDLFVDPASRRQGMARKLLDHIHEVAGAGGACEVTLSTAHTNQSARTLYESAGYRLDDKFRVYVRNLK